MVEPHVRNVLAWGSVVLWAKCATFNIAHALASSCYYSIV